MSFTIYQFGATIAVVQAVNKLVEGDKGEIGVFTAEDEEMLAAFCIEVGVILRRCV